MRTQTTSFSRDVSSFIARRIQQMNAEDTQAALQDIKQVTQRSQWNYLEYQCKPWLRRMLEEHWISLN